MNKDILNEMYGMLSLLSIEKEALKKNLYYLLQHKNKSDNKQNEIIDVVYQMATSAIEYEKSLKDIPFSGLYLHKKIIEPSYLMHISSKYIHIDLEESGLDLNSIDLEKVIDKCSELTAINKALITRLCDDIATYTESECCVFNGMSLTSRKFISDFLKFVVNSYTRSDYLEVFKLRYKGGITGFELFLIDLVFESAEDNLKLFNTNRAMVESIRGV